VGAVSRIAVFYDRNGKIASLVGFPRSSADAPPADVFPMQVYQRVEIELDEEQERIPLIDLHTRYRLDIEARRLVRITRESSE
jgi:hypothetical protein